MSKARVSQGLRVSASDAVPSEVVWYVLYTKRNTTVDFFTLLFVYYWIFVSYWLVVHSAGCAQFSVKLGVTVIIEKPWTKPFDLSLAVFLNTACHKKELTHLYYTLWVTELHYRKSLSTILFMHLRGFKTMIYDTMKHIQRMAERGQRHMKVRFDHEPYKTLWWQKWDCKSDKWQLTMQAVDGCYVRHHRLIPISILGWRFR